MKEVSPPEDNWKQTSRIFTAKWITLKRKLVQIEYTLMAVGSYIYRDQSCPRYCHYYWEEATVSPNGWRIAGDRLLRGIVELAVMNVAEVRGNSSPIARERKTCRSQRILLVSNYRRSPRKKPVEENFSANHPITHTIGRRKYEADAFPTGSIDNNGSS